MAKFIVDITITKTECWLVEAEDAADAETNYCEGGLVSTTEDACDYTGTEQVTDRKHG